MADITTIIKRIPTPIIVVVLAVTIIGVVAATYRTEYHREGRTPTHSTVVQQPGQRYFEALHAAYGGRLNVYQGINDMNLCVDLAPMYRRITNLPDSELGKDGYLLFLNEKMSRKGGCAGY